MAITELNDLSTGSDLGFEVDIEIENTTAQLADPNGYLLFGRLRVHTKDPIHVGGNQPGSLNVGYRILREGNPEILFEDRAILQHPVLDPEVWYGFTLRLPNTELIISSSLLQVDFVKEDSYWFHQLGNRRFETVVAFGESASGTSNAADSGTSLRRVPAYRHDEKNWLPYKSEPAVQQSQTTRYIFDISDLIQFWRDNINPTGIQRVQIEVLKAIIDKKIAKEFHDAKALTMHFDVERHSWSMIPNEILIQQIHTSSRQGVTKDAWRQELETMIGGGRVYIPANSDTIINLGSSWWIPDYLHKIQCLRLQYGVRYIPFIHDAIPLVTPQFCADGLVQEFRLWFRGAMSVADHIIVNSSSSHNDVVDWAIKLTGECAEVSIARLNAAFPHSEQATRTGIVERYNLDMSRYVICVGTLEARKNHALLLRVWSSLASKLPKRKIPKLVLVGKQGWMFDVAQALLAQDPNLKKSVIILDNLSDQELTDLYRNCIFTVYPSFYEGWGLPITEGLSYGKLTVASNTSSISEASSAGDILLDPNDFFAWQSTIEQLINDEEFLDAATQVSRERANIRTWPDVAADILLAAQSGTRRPADVVSSAVIDGRIYDFTLATARANFECSAQPFRAGVGWHHLEDWGAWSAPGVTELKFRVATSEARYVYLVLRGSVDMLNISVTVDGDIRLSRSVAPGERIILRAELAANQKCVHTIRLVVHNPIDLGRKTDGADKRHVGIGFQNMCCTKCADALARLNFSEAMGMQFI
jgi:glycosyltransferase involved in cell wall biosynthesis